MIRVKVLGDVLAEFPMDMDPRRLAAVVRALREWRALHNLAEELVLGKSGLGHLHRLQTPPVRRRDRLTLGSAGCHYQHVDLGRKPNSLQVRAIV